MNCKIVGYEFKHLEIELSPGEDFYGERGAFVYCDEGIDKQTEIIGTSISGVLLSKLSGESLLLVHYRNVSSSNRILVVAGSHANLLPLKLSGSDTLLIRRGAYVASSSRMKIDVNLSLKRIIARMSLMMQRITGDGTVFIDGIGIPIIKELQSFECIEVDENHVIALENIHENQISAGWNLSNIFRGEGLSTIKITGPGKVHLSPLSIVNSPNTR
ncbi:AIM24 family protein [Prevotella melaninogenica]|uniref:AIM24 family protein n=1 Tax=Prevotella melaninogenica TaxID=28132 RepID=UPI001C5FA3D8|nr:AIM24 family protein [Prevotella melaninogenica]MBW4724684.1 AIM24 family protein [Prevotella melaninogenica]